MIRKVAFGKAIIAGAAGALVWEIVARLLILTGFPTFDIVHLLGTLFVGAAPPWLWWPVGMAIHALVGAIWAIFYAYFFWSTFNWPPPLQGAVFALLIPSFLSGLVMMPQLASMHPLVLHGAIPDPGRFGINFGWRGPVENFMGHLLYGLVMGALYTHPVGSPVRRGRSARRPIYG